MIARVIFGVVAGAAIGGVVGYALRATGGACPLTCNPMGGMLMGAVFGLVIANTGIGATSPFTPSEHFVDIVNKEHFSRVLSQNEVVLVQFEADWCGPCRRLSPVIHELADEFAGKATVVGVDIDKNRDVAAAYGVSSIPDVRLFVNGKDVDRFVGTRSKAEYKRSVSKQIATELITE